MKLKFALLNLFLGCISFFITNNKFTSNLKAEELLKIELNTEIKKGKFLIGLKQYLGGENDSFSKKKNINFRIDKGFLNLISSNGIKHKSKQINITWEDMPIKNPKAIERIVFGPFASYESANKQSEKLKDKGFIKPLSVIKLIFFFLEKLSFSPPRYCCKPIKKFPFLISVLRSTLNNSSAFPLKENLVLIIKREIQPKNNFKKANLNFIN